jgi:hypothetical protein
MSDAKEDGRNNEGPAAEPAPAQPTDAEIAKVINLSNMFAGDVVKDWMMKLMRKQKVKHLFPDRFLGKIGAIKISGPDGSVVELLLAVVEPDYRLDWQNRPDAPELGQQIVYLLTMARTYIQFALQHYKSLRGQEWIYSQLTPTAHGTLYNLNAASMPRIGVILRSPPKGAEDAIKAA